MSSGSGGNAGSDWAPIVIAAMSFLGATLAQIVSHLFTLRREHTLRKEKADRYVEHIKFDIVLAVSELEDLIGSTHLNSVDREFVLGPRRSYSHPYINLIQRLDFNVDINPQFMLNTRKFFSLFDQEMERFSREVKGDKVSNQNMFAVVTLFLKGLEYIVATYRIQNRSWIARKMERRVPIIEVSYQDVLDSYEPIGFKVPDKTIFDSAKEFQSKVIRAPLAAGR